MPSKFNVERTEFDLDTFQQILEAMDGYHILPWLKKSGDDDGTMGRLSNFSVLRKHQARQPALAERRSVGLSSPRSARNIRPGTMDNTHTTMARTRRAPDRRCPPAQTLALTRSRSWNTRTDAGSPP